MYTEEGYLYIKMNYVLRTHDVNAFSSIKFYYTALMTAFEFYAKKNVRKEKNKTDFITIYRGGGISNEEIKYFQNPENLFKCRRYSEFLSFSEKEQTALKFMNKAKSDLRAVIKVHLDLHDNNKDFIKLSSELSLFPTEEEVLLRSGAIFELHEVKELNDHFEI